MADDGNPGYSLIVERSSSNLEVDLSTILVLDEPAFGSLDFENGITYSRFQSVSDFQDDSFVFIAQHSLFDSPVIVGVSVLGGFAEIHYEYVVASGTHEGKQNGDKEKWPNNLGSTNNGDGTVSVTNPHDVVVTGTIISGPGEIGIPSGTIIFKPAIEDSAGIGSDDFGNEIHVRPDLSSWEDVGNVLNQYDDKSISSIAINGHGAGEGGVLVGGDEEKLTGYNIPPWVSQVIDDKLVDDGKIFVLSCCQFELYSSLGLEQLAIKTGHPVVSNEENVYFKDRRKYQWGYFYGSGNWIELPPQ